MSERNRGFLVDRDPMIQEMYVDDPWRILVVGIVLNKTTKQKARPVLRRLFNRWPIAREFRRSKLRDVSRILEPSGFPRLKAKNMTRMTFAYLDRVPIDRLPGIGTYGIDCWSVFVEGRTNINPKDPELKQYVEGVRRGTFPGPIVG